MNFQHFFSSNSWWGKLLGAFFGFLIAGPVGAFFGILVGNFFDRGFKEYYSNPHWLYYKDKTNEVQKAFFEATFFIMGYIAKADGRVSEQEIHMAKELMIEMRLSNEQKNQAKHLFNQGKIATVQLDSILAQLKRLLSNNRGLLTLFLDIQYRAAQVDGLNSKKIEALNVVVTGLGFAPLNKQYRFYEDFTDTFYQQRQQQTHSKNQGRSYKTSNSGLDHAYALLEVSLTANKQEVKRAYRRALSQNHPDKLIAQGLPQEMIKMANDKTQKIIKAYELICENKGW